MPEIAFAAIIDYCNYPDIQSLRKVCKSLRQSIDLLLPDSHVRDLSVKTQSIDKIKLKMRFPNRPDLIITYNQHENGCLLIWNTGDGEWDRVVENIDFLTLFFNDFGLFLRHQKANLHFFQIRIEVEIPEFLENLEKVLKSKKYPLKVDELDLTVFSERQILSILPWMDSEEKIQRIWIAEPDSDERMLDLEEVVKSNQWKNAREIEILWFTIDVPMENFHHFSIARVFQMEIITGQDIVNLKEILLNSNDSKFFHFDYKTFQDDENLLDQNFGEPDTCLDETDFLEKRWKIEAGNREISIKLCCSYVEMEMLNCR